MTKVKFKIYLLGTIVNAIVLFPVYFYLYKSNAHKAFFVGMPVCLFIFFLSHRFFIFRAKKKGYDLKNPI
jgi:uncharacterized membrane protein YdjX (TVP38/TMEM64 family)